MAQRYIHPESVAWMKQDLCPECGKPAPEHLNDPRFWLPRSCDLMPSGVTDRIEQYNADRAAEVAPFAATI